LEAGKKTFFFAGGDGKYFLPVFVINFQLRFTINLKKSKKLVDYAALSA